MDLVGTVIGGFSGLIFVVVTLFIVWMKYYKLSLSWPPKLVSSPSREQPQRQLPSHSGRSGNRSNPLNDVSGDDIADVILSCAIRETEGDKCCICLCGMDEEGLVLQKPEEEQQQQFDEHSEAMSEKDPSDDVVDPFEPTRGVNPITQLTIDTREAKSSSPFASPINSPRGGEEGDMEEAGMEEEFSIVISSPDDNSPDSEPRIHIEASSFSSAPTEDVFENTHSLWIRLPCDHVFHGTCIKDWLETKSSADKTCPMCRSAIVRPFSNNGNSECRPSNE